MGKSVLLSQLHQEIGMRKLLFPDFRLADYLPLLVLLRLSAGHHRRKFRSSSINSAGFRYQRCWSCYKTDRSLFPRRVPTPLLTAGRIAVLRRDVIRRAIIVTAILPLPSRWGCNDALSIRIRSAL